MKSIGTLTGLGLVLGASVAWAQTAAPASRAQQDAYERELAAAARRDASALRACVDGARPEALQVREQLRAVSAVIGADGGVGSVRIDAPGAMAPVFESCVQHVAHAWRVSPPAGGVAVTVSYPRAAVERGVAQVRGAR